MRVRDLWHDFDWTLLAAILVLSCISLVEIYSATKNSPAEHYAVFRQMAWVILGIGLLVRGVKPTTLVVMLVIVILALPAAWPFLGQHQKDRIRDFVNPEQNLKGSGYQVNQSKIAIGSGGILGKGIFKGSQNQLG